MKIAQGLYLIILGCLCMQSLNMYCVLESGSLITSAREFNTILDEYRFLVVYAYDLPTSSALSGSSEKTEMSDAELLTRRLSGSDDKRDLFYKRYEALVEVANSNRYRAAHVGFFGVNVAKNDLNVVKSMLKLSDGDDVLLLFKDGRPLEHRLTANEINEIDIRMALEDEFKYYIDEEIQDQKQQKKELQLARNKKAFVESTEKSSGKSCKSCKTKCKKRRCSSCCYAPWWAYGNYYCGPYPYYPAPYCYGGCGWGWGGCCNSPGFGFGVTLCA